MARFGVERGGGGGPFSADREISGIFTELWKLDENRLTPGKHYRINLQRGQPVSAHNHSRVQYLRTTKSSIHFGSSLI